MHIYRNNNEVFRMIRFHVKSSQIILFNIQM